MSRRLSPQDVEPLFAAFSGQRAVLIGGQALNLWCQLYASRSSELAREAPFTSKDVDIQGDQDVVIGCARALGAVAHVSRNLHDTTNAGYISANLNGESVGINVLFGPFGVRADEARSTAVPVDIGASTLLVLNPVLCMEGRMANVAGLPGRDTPHDLRQARASILCAREYIVDVAAGLGPRPALWLVERVFRFALRNRAARHAFSTHGLDCFEAIRPLEQLPESFRTTRYPQMQRQILLHRSH